MMKRIMPLFVFLSLSLSLVAQEGNKILGIWYNEKKDSKIEIFQKEGRYFGKIIWLKNNKNEDGSSPRLDKKNPDNKLKVRPVVGTVILSDLKWESSENEWNDGEIYDPRSGSTYSVFARLQDPKTLYLKGYIGFSLIGRSTTWTRME